MADKESQKKENQGEQRKIKFVGDPSQVDDVFADGLSGVVGRGGIVKFEFYRFLGVDQAEETEIRQITQRLVLPVNAVQELFTAIKGIAEAEKRKKTESND